jgi:redox-sensitive bicupin YhaK (pirin superfamily)
VSGALIVRVPGEKRTLSTGTATTVSAGPEVDVVLKSNEPSHFVLMAAKPIREPLVKAGP